MIRYLTAGESHGKCLIAVIEGMPSNLPINIDKINNKLSLRQTGYGRGKRMGIENDKVEVLSGIRNSKTIGSPICIKIENMDWENWKEVMDPIKALDKKVVTVPRPGHADLSGVLKYNLKDIADVIERSSARETAIRVAIGSIAEQFLNRFNISIYSHVTQIGDAYSKVLFRSNNDIIEQINKSKFRCLDKNVEEKMKTIIDKAKENGDTVGGIFEVVAKGLPIGLGSYAQWDRRLDARICYGLMSIHGIKGVEFGLGFEYANKTGSGCHDEILYKSDIGYYRTTNNAGGIEGGMSNGENIVVRAIMKPIPTLVNPLMSVDINTKENIKSDIHRSDVCAVPAASIVGQSIVAWELAYSFLEKFGGDSIEETEDNYLRYNDINK